MLDLFLGNDGAYLLLIIGALFVHMSYQLSVSVLTYMSSHRLGHKAPVKQLLWLGSNYIVGAVVTTTLLLVTIASFLAFLESGQYAESAQFTVNVALSLVPLVGLLTVTVYYRQGKGTRLWLPRPIANYLLKRAEKTRSGFESAMLGAATVVGELPFLAGPILIAGLAVASGPSPSWAVVSLVYSLIACVPLAVVTLYLTSGHSIARVQKWREKNKEFLQWTSGIALVLLTAYFAITQIGLTS